MKCKILFILGFIIVQISTNGQISFKDVTEEAGLVKPFLGMMGHNACWGDVNGDSYPDLFYGTFADRPDSIYNLRGHTDGSQPNKLMINLGDGTFKEKKGSPVSIRGRNSGGVFADLDYDGDLDFVISNQSFEGSEFQKPNNFLFENDGDGNFKDVTQESGLQFGWPFTGRSTFPLDYDGDGLLDLLMQEDYAREDVSGGNSRLMKNMGNFKFNDVTKEAGLPYGYQTGFYGLGGVVGDINGDMWADIFFAHSCRMFINTRNGFFKECSFNFIPQKFRQPAKINKHWTCGADMGDLDNDGDMDLILGDHFSEDTTFHRIYVFQNEGNDENNFPIFKDITLESKLIQPNGRAIHVQIQDIDNDGRMDLITSRYFNFIYRNKGIVNGIPEFDKPIDSGIAGGISYWAGGTLGDYDRDGKLDFFGSEWEPGFPAMLLKNVTKNAENYIDIKLDIEKSKNRNGIGAKVEVYRRGKLNKKQGLLGTYIISVCNGYSSGYEPIAHFGLPNDSFVDIKVTMTCNKEVIIKKSIKRNQLFVIKK